MSAIEDRIRGQRGALTPAEQKLAAYFLAHLQELPFETAASIGKLVGVSPMTVGRYIRKLGYADLRGVKNDLRAGAGPAQGPDESSRAGYTPASLRAKIGGLSEVYKLQRSPEWTRIATLIARASTVHVASFQVGRFLGIGFAAFLQNLRPRVYFADGSDGAYADILIDPLPGACLVLIDARRYSPHFRLLAEEAAARGVRTVILTDLYCHWARSLTDDVLMIEMDFGIRTLSVAELLLELLLGAVADELEGTEARFEQIDRLRRTFVGAADGAGRQARGP